MLTESDWFAVKFYQRVRDQFYNQTPMGQGDGKPCYLSPRLEGYEAALRIYGYPQMLHGWLTDWARFLHALCHDMDDVDWFTELGKPLNMTTYEDFL